MSEHKTSSTNYIISVDRFMADQARQRVIKENGQLVTPAYEKPFNSPQPEGSQSLCGNFQDKSDK